MSESVSGSAGVTFAEKAQFELLCLVNHVVEGDLNVGRPAQIVPGSAQHACMAITGELAFPRAGGYLLRGVLNGDMATLRTWEFRVHDIAIMPTPPQLQ